MNCALQDILGGEGAARGAEARQQVMGRGIFFFINQKM